MSETPTVCFPTDIGVNYGVSYGNKFKTFVQELADGSVQRRTLWRASGVFNATFTTVWLEDADVQRVRDFLEARRGSKESFYLFLASTGAVYKKYLVGTTSGSAGQAITIPFRESAVSAIYIDGSPLTGGSTFTPNFGTFGEDKITITAAQTAGKPITIDVIGRLRVAGIAQDGDAIPVNVPDTIMWTFTIHFRGI